MKSTATKSIVLSLVVFSLLGASCTLRNQPTARPQTTPANTSGGFPVTDTTEFFFEPTEYTPGFVSAAPNHEAILPGVPVNVVLDFGSELDSTSTMKIVNEGTDYGFGEMAIDEYGKSMRRLMNQNAPNGLYTVDYTACFADGDCERGMLQFAIDRSTTSRFDDLRGSSILSISIDDMAFKPRNIRINRGTIVTWKNNDTEPHFVSSDPAVTHTYFPDLNSTELQPGEAYGFTFQTPGVYMYHCSNHPDTMTATILVE